MIGTQSKNRKSYSKLLKLGLLGGLLLISGFANGEDADVWASAPVMRLKELQSKPENVKRMDIL